MKPYEVQAYPGVPRNLCKVVVLYRSVMLRTLIVRQCVYHIVNI